MSDVQEIPERVQSIVGEHLGEVAFLRGQLLNSLESPANTLLDHRRLEQRLLAHLEALRCYEADAVRVALPYLVEGSDPGELYAAACVVLAGGGADGAAAVERALGVASPAGRRGIVAAMAHFGSEEVVDGWLDRAREKFPAGLVDVAWVVALRRPERFSDIFEFGLLRNPEPATRITAWTSLRCCPAKARSEQTLAGALDEHAVVRRLALETAVWAGQSWVLDHCRRAAAKASDANWAELELLSILACGEDTAAILALAGKTMLGARRYRLLGSLALPEGIPLLLQAMSSGSLLEAAVAGEVFTRITGRPLRIVDKMPVPPKDGSMPDDFEAEFLDEAAVPDAGEAAKYWDENKDRYLADRRYSQGLPVPEEKTFFPELDIVSIREACLRAAFAGKRGPSAAYFERIPLVLN